jgi:hypothetical protein
MKRSAGYNLLHHARNEDILKELRVDPIGQNSAQRKQT